MIRRSLFALLFILDNGCHTEYFRNEITTGGVSRHLIGSRGVSGRVFWGNYKLLVVLSHRKFDQDGIGAENLPSCCYTAK